MSGLAARFFTGATCAAGAAGAECDQIARSFCGPNHAPLTYVDTDVAIVVASRGAAWDGGLSASRGEIVETARYVLAVEGYVLNLAEFDGASVPARQRSRADLVLGLFERHGASVFERLNGGYSLVIWDKSERVATVRTCKFGQRNLYRMATGEGTAVASDLQALRRMCGCAFELDDDTAWMSFLHGGVYGERTSLRNVTRVLPGSTLTVRKGTVTGALARDIARRPRDPVRHRRDHYVEQLDSAMRQAVSRLGRLSATNAVMLGSGVDSSLVAAYAKDEMQELFALTQQMPGDADESRGAARIVSALGIRHAIVPYEPLSGDLVDQVSAFVRIAEEPAYWNQLGPPLLQLLSALEDKPQSFLTGAEGDFLFHFRSPRRPSVVQVIRDGLFWPVTVHTARRLVNQVTRHTYIVGSDFDLLDRRFMSRHLRGDFSADRNGIVSFDPAYPHLDTGLNAQRHLINNGWQNIRIISQLGCDAGAEVLFPYLDDDVVACVLSLPDELKINKGLLRILLAGFLPRRVVPRTKTGYWAHTIKWHYDLDRVHGALDILSDRRTRERGTYDVPALGALIDLYAGKAAAPRCHPVLWQLLVFEMFCREFVDPLPWKA
jgi:asparagine synthetase B (glutamine-hydrolysing)